MRSCSHSSLTLLSLLSHSSLTPRSSCTPFYCHLAVSRPLSSPIPHRNITANHHKNIKKVLEKIQSRQKWNAFLCKYRESRELPLCGKQKVLSEWQNILFYRTSTLLRSVNLELCGKVACSLCDYGIFSTKWSHVTHPKNWCSNNARTLIPIAIQLNR